MADTQVLDIYQELLSRNAVPPQHKDTVDELVRRGVLTGASQQTPKPQQQNVGTGESFLRNMNNALTFGWYDPLVAGAKSALTGSDFKETRAREDARTAAARQNIPARVLGETAGMTAQGLASLPRQAAVGSVAAAQEALRPVVSGAQAFMEGLPTALRYGGAYGAAQGLGSSRADTTAGQVGDLASGAAGGAAMGAAGYGALYGLGTGMARLQRGQEARRDANAARLQEMRDAGVSDPLPATVSDNRLLTGATRVSEVTPGGATISARAAQGVGQVQNRLRDTLAQPVGGRETGDLGRMVQDDLRYNLTRRSRSSDEISGMTRQDIEAFTGPVTDDGFMPPRPRVDPIPPRPVQPIQPRDIGPEPAPPQAQQYVRQFSSQLDDINARIDASVAEHNAIVQGVSQQRSNINKALADAGIVEVRPTGQGFTARLSDGRVAEISGRVSPDQLGLSSDQYLAAQNAIRGIRDLDSVQAEALKRVEEIRELHAQRGSLETHFRQAQAQEAGQQTSFQRQRADYQARQTQAAREASEETARLQEQARLRADAETRAAQQAAERAYQERVDSGDVGFRAGRSRETYPTEFDAAYELAGRETPRVQFNPLGTRYAESSTSRLMQDVAREAKQSRALRGFTGSIYADDGTLKPAFVGFLRNRIGDDLASRFTDIAAARYRGAAQMGPAGVKRLLSDIRRAARTAERPPFPGTPRTEDAAILRRMEGALREDYYRVIGQSGDAGQGPRAVSMMRSVDQQYERYINELRRPLSRIFGENVEPVQAMDRLARAARDGEVAIIGPFMRVMSEKSDPNRGVAALLMHMSGGGRDMQQFITAYRSLPDATRRAMFAAPEARALQTQLDRYATVGERLLRYTNSDRPRPAIDPTRLSHIVTVAGVWAHLPTVLAGVAGNAALSRVLSSPRLLRWMTTFPEAARGGFETARFRRHLAALGGLAGNDQDSKQVTSALKRAVAAAISNPANAAFGGENAENAPSDALERAQKMIKDGANTDSVWKDTGWMKGKDGNWRFEIDDREATVELPDLTKLPMTKARAGWSPGRSATLGDVFDHEGLYGNYPDIRGSRVVFAKPREDGLEGQYFRDKNSFVLYVDSRLRGDALKSTILHEIQHAIQDIEGFDYGSFKAIYDKRPGEIESSEVEKRINMNPKQRQMTLPGLVVR